jgi:AraC family transcriptional regulator
MHDSWSDALPVREEVAECVAIDPVFATPLFLVYHWQCKRECACERCHPWYVLGLPRSGASLLQMQGREQLMGPGHAILHEPFATYTSSHPFGCGDRGWNIAIRRETLGLEEGDTRGEPLSRVTSVPERDLARWRLAIERWRREGEPAVETAEVEEATLTLIGGVIRRMRDSEEPSVAGPRRPDTEEDHDRVFERARAEIFLRFREPIRLADLARAACASPFHLCRVFKRASGLSVHRYVNRLRLLAALEEIAERDVSLTDLALDLGFSSHSHFTLAFRRELGITPSELRRQVTGRRMALARRVLSGSAVP